MRLRRHRFSHITHITGMRQGDICYWTALPEETWNCVRRSREKQKRGSLLWCWIRRKRLWAPECLEVAISNSRRLTGMRYPTEAEAVEELKDKAISREEYPGNLSPVYDWNV